jgi:hypothetical protein
VIVIDTGPVIAAANRKDSSHQPCAELLETFPGPLLLPQPLLAEIGYMLASRAGVRAEVDFLHDVADGVCDATPTYLWATLTQSLSRSPSATARPPSLLSIIATSTSSALRTYQPSLCCLDKAGTEHHPAPAWPGSSATQPDPAISIIDKVLPANSRGEIQRTKNRYRVPTEFLIADVYPL